MKKDILPEQGIKDMAEYALRMLIDELEQFKEGIAQTVDERRLAEAKAIYKEITASEPEIKLHKTSKPLHEIWNLVHSCDSFVDFQERVKKRGLPYLNESLSPVGEVTDEEIEAEALKRYPETVYFDDENDCYIDYNSRLRHGFVTGQKLMRDKMRSQALSSTEKEDAVGFVEWLGRNNWMSGIMTIGGICYFQHAFTKEPKTIPELYDLYKSNPPKQ